MRIKDKKKFAIILIIIAILVIIITGIIIRNNIKKDDDKPESITNLEDTLDFSSKRLIVVTDKKLTETYNAKNVRQSYYGDYVLDYETEAEAKNAFKIFRADSQIKEVCVDANGTLLESQALTIKQYFGDNETALEGWGVYAMGLNETQDILNEKSQKDDIVVAVIDSGFDLTLDILDEQNLRNRIDENYINITDGSKNIADDTISYGHTEIDGHGTHVGAIILDGTPDNVKILPIKVDSQDLVNEYNKDGISRRCVIQAIQYAIEKNVDVINISLSLNPPNQELTDIINEAVRNNIVVVASAGNDGAEQIAYPAAYDNVIAVSALSTNLINVEEVNGEYTITNPYDLITAKESTKENLSIADFSNYGNEVDFSAPGDIILSLVPHDSGMVDHPMMAGTSQASPHIAAAAATIKSYNKELTNNEVYAILEHYSLDLGNKGKDTYYGNGMPCFRNFEECTCGCERCDEIYCDGCSCENCIYHNEIILDNINLNN